MESKVITISDDTQIKSVQSEKPPLHRVVITNEKWELQDDDYIAENQCIIFTEGSNKNDAYKKMKKEVQRKISSYKSQDKSKNLYDPDNFVDFTSVRDLLLKDGFKCYYCNELVKLLYKFVRESKQWSLERIDNNFGHNKDNVTIACLNCNLKRRTMYHERFLFTKQLNIVKTDI